MRLVRCSDLQIITTVCFLKSEVSITSFKNNHYSFIWHVYDVYLRSLPLKKQMNYKLFSIYLLKVYFSVLDVCVKCAVLFKIDGIEAVAKPINSVLLLIKCSKLLINTNHIHKLTKKNLIVRLNIILKNLLRFNFLLQVLIFAGQKYAKLVLVKVAWLCLFLWLGEGIAMPINLLCF